MGSGLVLGRGCADYICRNLVDGVGVVTYQSNLFTLEVMQDHSGRCTDYPAPPKSRMDCIEGRENRSLPPDRPEAERCQCFGCPYNLIGEIGRMKSDGDMERAFTTRYETETWDTCLLDVLGPLDEMGRAMEQEDATTGRLLGISGERVSQVVANAAFKLRKAHLVNASVQEQIENVRRGAYKIPFATPETERGLTDAQEEAIEAIEEHGTLSAAAESIGISISSLRDRLKGAGYER